MPANPEAYASMTDEQIERWLTYYRSKIENTDDPVWLRRWENRYADAMAEKTAREIAAQPEPFFPPQINRFIADLPDIEGLWLHFSEFETLRKELADFPELEIKVHDGSAHQLKVSLHVNLGAWANHVSTPRPKGEPVYASILKVFKETRLNAARTAVIYEFRPTEESIKREDFTNEIRRFITAHNIDGLQYTVDLPSWHLPFYVIVPVAALQVFSAELNRAIA